MKRVAVVLLAIWLGAWNGYADAAPCTSQNSGNWNNCITWSGLLCLLSCGGIIGGTPTASSQVTISSGDTVTVNVSNAAADTVTAQGSSTLQFNSGTTLNVGNGVTNGGTTTVGAGNMSSASFTNNNTVSVSTGQINVTGAYTNTTTGDTLTIGAGSLISGGTLTNGGSIIFSGTGTVNANGDFSSSGTVTNTAAGTINIKGAATVNGTFTAGSGTVAFIGTSNQAVSGSALGFYNVTMNNTAGITLSNNLTADGTLTFTRGNITTGANKVSVGTAGSVSGASSTTGYVSGCMEKLYPAGASSFIFTIGDATAYTPVDASVTATGNLSFCTATPDHPNIGSSSLDPNFTVNRYWTATSSAVPGTYSATFNFLTSDIDQSAAPANFVVQRYVAPTWYDATVGTRAITSTQATGLTAVGDFAIGESRPRPRNSFIYLRENF